MSVVPPSWEATLADCAAGAISPEVALCRLILSGDPPDPGRVAAATDGGDAALARLVLLAAEHADAVTALLPVFAAGLNTDGIPSVAALFDRLAAQAPEAGVALYALGSPALLGAVTAELLAVARAWAPFAGRDVLDLGCGIGRVAIAMADDARAVLGLDVSAGMIAEARRRAGTHPRLRFEQGSGRDLRGIADRSVDLVLAVDSWPFLVSAGEALVDAHVAEAARVLRPGGDLLVFNWSYRGDGARDMADARGLALDHGFALVRAGETPFRIWDGNGFHLRRRA